MKQKKDFSNIILIIIFFIGMSIVLYPTISNYWNQRTQTAAIVNYDKTISNIDEEEYKKIFEKAEQYNENLSQLDFPLSQSKQISGYEECLNIIGNGMMGYIRIDKIDVELPIYHGTSDAVLDIAAGHIQGSSLPIGGEGTHSLISSHRGLPSARLFTDLDKLEIGDIFTIVVLNKVITYEVDQIRIVEPHDLKGLGLEEGKDYCTLITCTPYGINTHRLLVRGHRVENIVDMSAFVVSDAVRIEPIIVAIFIAIFIIIILTIIVLVKYRKKK